MPLFREKGRKIVGCVALGYGRMTLKHFHTFGIEVLRVALRSSYFRFSPLGLASLLRGVLLARAPKNKRE